MPSPAARTRHRSFPAGNCSVVGARLRITAALAAIAGLAIFSTLHGADAATASKPDPKEHETKGPDAWAIATAVATMVGTIAAVGATVAAAYSAKYSLSAIRQAEAAARHANAAAQQAEQSAQAERLARLWEDITVLSFFSAAECQANDAPFAGKVLRNVNKMEKIALFWSSNLINREALQKEIGTQFPKLYEQINGITAKIHGLNRTGPELIAQNQLMTELYRALKT